VAGLVSPAIPVPRISLVRGSHIVVPRIAGAYDAYLMQNPDGRVVFALPFAERFTLIGTTDVPVTTPAAGFQPSDAEEAYLLETAGRFFARAPSPQDIVWRFAGVRPLMDDGASRASAVSRDYKLDLVESPDGPPLLNVIGGKITTFRCLAESALDRLAPYFPRMGPSWTARSPLPGGGFGARGPGGFRQSLATRHPDVTAATLDRLARLYGTGATQVLDGAKSDHDLGRALGGGLTESEVLYLRDREWAETAQDVLWRRTKAGLGLTPDALRDAEERITHLLGS
jgi:glycerol-3-phosphate dehydrogenase